MLQNNATFCNKKHTTNEPNTRPAVRNLLRVLPLFTLLTSTHVKESGGSKYVRSGSLGESPLRSAGSLGRVRSDTADPVIERMMVFQRAGPVADVSVPVASAREQLRPRRRYRSLARHNSESSMVFYLTLFSKPKPLGHLECYSLAIRAHSIRAGFFASSC